MVWEKRVRFIAWVCFVLLWIPMGLIIITGVTEGDEGFMDMMIVPFILLSVLFAILLSCSYGIGWLEKENIKKKGMPAKATILRVSDTGTLINNRPVLRIELEVQPPYDSRFLATVEYRVPYSALPAVQPGRTVQVYYLEGSREVALAGL